MKANTTTSRPPGATTMPTAPFTSAGCVSRTPPAAWRETPYFTDAERAALALTEAVTRICDRPDPVPDEVWDEAARHYDEQALGTLVLAIANINVWNRLNVATRQVPGAVEW